MRDPYLGSQSAIYKQTYHLHDCHTISNYSDLKDYISQSTTPPIYKRKNIRIPILDIQFLKYTYILPHSFCTPYTYMYIYLMCINIIVFQKVSKLKYEGYLLRLGLQLSCRVLV